MAGIAPQPAGPNPDPQSQGPDEVGDEEGLQPNVSPEEQKAYEKFVLAGMMLIYQKGSDAPQGSQDSSQQGIAPDSGSQDQTPSNGGKVRPGILKLLDDDHADLQAILKVPQVGGKDPVVAIAATTVVIVLELMKAVSPEDNITDAVAMHGAAALLEELAEIWMRKNQQQLGEDDVHRALSMASALYEKVGTDAGLVDPKALKAQFDQLVQADKSGNLASISPDLAGINKAAEINQQQGDDVSQSDQGGDQQAEEQSEPSDNPQEEEQEQQ